MKNLFIVESDFCSSRIDEFLSEMYQNEGISRSLIQKWILSGCVSIGDKKITKSSFKVKESQEILVTSYKAPEINLEPVKMDLPIIYETENYIVINKPAGISTHAGNKDEKLHL